MLTRERFNVFLLLLLLCRTECCWRLARYICTRTDHKAKDKATLSKILDNLDYKRIKVKIYAVEIWGKKFFGLRFNFYCYHFQFPQNSGSAYWAWLPVSGRQGIRYVPFEYLLCRAENEPYFCKRYSFKRKTT